MKLFILWFFVCLCANSVFAQTSTPIYGHWLNGAVAGYDVVEFYDLQSDQVPVKGLSSLSYEWQGVTWRFTSSANREAFIASPESFVPQFGGYCAFAAARGYLLAPRVNYWTVIDGKLYFFNNASTFGTWKQDSPKNIELAQKKWPQLVSSLPAPNAHNKEVESHTSSSPSKPAEPLVESPKPFIIEGVD